MGTGCQGSLLTLRCWPVLDVGLLQAGVGGLGVPLGAYSTAPTHSLCSSRCMSGVGTERREENPSHGSAPGEGCGGSPHSPTSSVVSTSIMSGVQAPEGTRHRGSVHVRVLQVLSSVSRGQDTLVHTCGWAMGILARPCCGICTKGTAGRGGDHLSLCPPSIPQGSPAGSPCVRRRPFPPAPSPARATAAACRWTAAAWA